MRAKFDLKCINFKCILQSRKTVGIKRVILNPFKALWQYIIYPKALLYDILLALNYNAVLLY
jgi:hypothetical protein